MRANLARMKVARRNFIRTCAGAVPALAFLGGRDAGAALDNEIAAIDLT